MTQSTRPLFEPVAISGSSNSLIDDSHRPWIPVIQCVAHFPVELFESVMINLVYHPELTVDLILRAEIEEPELEMQDRAGHVNASSEREFQINDYYKVRRIRRKLIPKIPERDPALVQDCIFYRAAEGLETQLVALFPLLKAHERIPHYHPKVNAIAFRFVPSSSSDGDSFLRIDLVPRDDIPITRTSRLFKTCYLLLDTIHKHGWGAMTGYQKRMTHDTIIPKETYQDFYHNIMKERHKGLKETWAESTDAIKNVYEDIGIATFLMLLWKDMYPPFSQDGKEKWGRPPGGFVDMGCGAGLLVHILAEEGYEGIGLDIRARKSWELYPVSTRRRLHQYALNPLSADFPDTKLFKPGIFLIGNHADELSPWIPVIASLVDNAAYLSIPCCPWALDQRFHRTSLVFPPMTAEGDEHLEKRLGATCKSTYGAYICWLATLSKEVGFTGEYEALRIPTTRNWAIIGRARAGHEAGKERARKILEMVVKRALFKARQGVNSNH